MMNVWSGGERRERGSAVIEMHWRPLPRGGSDTALPDTVSTDRVAVLICHATYITGWLCEVSGVGTASVPYGDSCGWGLEEAANDDSHYADCLLHQMRGGGGVAGCMGTERGETVRTLHKAPWVRTDHHSSR